MTKDPTKQVYVTNESFKKLLNSGDVNLLLHYVSLRNDMLTRGISPIDILEKSATWGKEYGKGLEDQGELAEACIVYHLVASASSEIFKTNSKRGDMKKTAIEYAEKARSLTQCLPTS